MSKVQLVVSVLLLVFLLVACAPKAVPAPMPQPPAPAGATAPAPTGAAVPRAPAKAAWETEWDRTVEAAKKEGRVIFYFSGSAEARRALLEAFGAKYGIALETLSGRGAEMVTKILAERKAGIYAADVFSTGASTLLNTLKPVGGLEPMDAALILPEVKNAELWWEGHLAWVDKEHMILGTLTDIKETIAVNTNLVKPEELRSYRDLLDSRWKGKISLQDPIVGGTGTTWFMSMIQMGVVDEAYMRKLVDQQQMVMVTERRLQLEWVAHGKYPVALAPDRGALTDMLATGAPVRSLIPSEGTYITSTTATVSLFNRPAHPNAAKLFLNFFLSKEGQTILSKGLLSQSRRLDVPTDFLPQDRVRKPGVNYWNSETEERLLERGKFNKLAKEIFARK